MGSVVVPITGCGDGAWDTCAVHLSAANDFMCEPRLNIDLDMFWCELCANECLA